MVSDTNRPPKEMDFQQLFLQTTPVEWILIALLFAIFCVQLFIYVHYYTGIVRHNREERPTAHTQPPVSVIICARDETENLEQFLPLILEQDYPDYEVIVVNDGESEATEMLLAQLEHTYPHLRHTYTPEQTDIISRKKLGLTIGIKAARNEILLFTDADCRPVSSRWIAEMTAHFDDSTEFVLGYGGYIPENTLLSRLISYDTITIAMQYLGFAYRGKPYMGVGRNLAYRRSSFFEHKGFAGLLHIASGDDDLLINKFANGTNTRFVATAESITQSTPKPTFVQWCRQKARHLTAAPLYSPESQRMVALEPATRGLFYALAVAICCIGGWLTIGCTLTLYLFRYIFQAIVINTTATQLSERHFYLTIPLFDIFLPIITLFLLIFGRKKGIKWK